MVTRKKKVERDAKTPRRTRARLMRHDPMYCERLLWNELRDRKLDGFKFKRQHLIGRYIVDFACVEKKLVVELDGRIHKLKREADATRDAVLRARGYRTLRISNEDLIRDLSAGPLMVREALRNNL